MAGYIGSKVVSLSTAASDISGNITVGGTVDGRDVSVDGTKLDGIEASATADQTKADIEGLGIDLPAANLTGTIAAARLDTATTQAESDDSTKIATTAYVVDKITTLIGGAPSTLNDLNELAAAINDDENYNSTLTTALATKLPLAGGTVTGDVTFNTQVGIGTSSPNSYSGYGAMTINGTTGSLLDFEVNETVTGEVYADSGITDLGIGLQAVGSRILHFKTNNQERMRISAAGDMELIQGNNLYWKHAGGGTIRAGITADSADNLAFSTGSSDSTAMTIDGNGNVGIGCTPASTVSLDVQNLSASSNNVFLRIKNATNLEDSGLIIEGQNGGAREYKIGVNSIANSPDLTFSGPTGYRFYTGATQRMTLDSNGRVGIGESSPLAKMDILGGNGDQVLLNNAGERFTQISFCNNNAQEAAIWYDATDNYLVAHANAGDGFKVQTGGSTDRLIINATGTVGITGNLDLPNVNSYITGNGHNVLQVDATRTYFYGGTNGVQFRTADNASALVDITNAGNVGINTTAPDFYLHVNKGTSSYSPASNSTVNHVVSGFNTNYDAAGTEGIYLANMEGNWLDGVSGTDSAFGMLFGWANNVRGGLLYDARSTEKLQLFSSYAPIEFMTGGTSGNSVPTDSTMLTRMSISPTGQVDVTGGRFNVIRNQNADFVAKFENNGGGGYGIASDNSAGNHIFFYRNGSGTGTITDNGTTIAFNTISDYRLKTDVQPMTGASARVQALNPVNFEWTRTGTRTDGFLAHEAQSIVPESVTGTKDAMREEEYEVTAAIEKVTDEYGNVTTEAVDAVMGTRSVPDYQGIDQSKLVPLLTAALQEALTEITALKARVTALEA